MDPDQETIEDVDDQEEDDVDLDDDDDESSSSSSSSDENEGSEGSDDTTSDDDDDDEMNGKVNGNGQTKQNKLNDDEYKTKLNELENSLKENKFQYQSYVDIIQLSRDNADMAKLKEFRQQMSQLFPLTENLWLEWLKDEQKLMVNEQDRHEVKNLFEKAIEDYLSVEIWLEFIHFSIGGMGETNGIENVRRVCERAISFAGLHFIKGNILWEAYREFESAILSGYQQTYAGTVQSAEQTQQTNEQINRINTLFKRELAVCLEKGAATFAEFKQFDENQITDQLQKIHAKTIEKLKEIQPFETALKNPEFDSAKKLNEYKSYLDFELKKITDLEKQKIKQNNKSNNETLAEEASTALTHQRERLKCLFERSLSDDSNCLDVALWLKYIHYLNEEEGFIETNDTQRDFNLSVAKRSVRNCPWSSHLWINYALLLERINSPVDSVKALFNEAMNAGLQTSSDYLNVWHAYLDYLKRLFVKNQESKENQAALIDQLREYFQKAINQQFDYFKHQGDPTFSLEKYWACVEAKYFKSMDQCRKIYNEMVLAKSDQCKYSPVWIEFYDLEREFGDEKHQRKLLNRALNEVANASEKEIIYELLIKFEKLDGNVQQYSNIYFKYEQFKQEQSLIKQTTFAAKKKTETNNKKDLPSSKTQPKQQTPPAKANNGRASLNGARPVEQQSKQENNLKRKKSDPDFIQPDSKKQLKDKDGFAIPSLPAMGPPPTPPVSSSQSKAAAVTAASVAAESTADSFKNKFSNLTVFISNLSYDADENKIKAVFEKEPGFKEMRVLKNWSGKSKGYGYVDFETSEQATNALKLDRTPIDGRPMFVSKNEDKSADVPSANKLKYAANLEKNKLFVSGLPFNTENKDLEEIFKTFGKLKEVRIVTYKNGKSKGLAYVEFEDEQSASKALIQTDRMLIGEFQISVAISNPPKRKQDGSESTASSSSQISGSLGSGSFKTGTPATSSRSNAAIAFTSFMPRSQMIGRKTKIDFKK